MPALQLLAAFALIRASPNRRMSVPAAIDALFAANGPWSLWLRVLDSIQLTAKHKVATPVNWKNGEDVIIVPAVSDDEAKQKYPDGWKAPKPYLRIVPQPK